MWARARVQPGEDREPAAEGLAAEEHVEDDGRVLLVEKVPLHHRELVEVSQEGEIHGGCGGWGIRTPDLQIANLPLYQLS